MNSKALSILAACAALMADSSPLRAGSFTEAKVTRIENQVSILKENAAPRTATVGDNVDAVSSVATGAASRVELQFPDKSLTRLGANSRFTIRGEARTLDLEQGVMFLQVPKQMGGAKIRTGAVTAAVTGTTVIIEKLSNSAVDFNGAKPSDLKAGGAKIIVVEGVVEVYRDNKPGEFRTINAGEMFLIDLDSPGMPTSKKVDIKQMLKSGNSFFQSIEGTPNAKQADAAIQHQQSEIASGVLKKLDVIIPGRGSLASVANNSSQVAHNAQLVHAVNNSQGKGAQNLVNLLAAGNNGLGGINGIGNGNGNGKGKGKGLALGQGQGNGNGKGNGNGNGNKGGSGNGNGNSNAGGPGNPNAGPKPKK